MYLKIKNGEVVEYPYSLKKLRAENPNTSFPRFPSEKILKDWGVEKLSSSSKPAVDHTENLVEEAPILKDGVWTQVWSVVGASSEQIAERVANKERDVRGTRDANLADTDWTQVSDAPLTESQKMSWASYRQQLRDLTQHARFPFLTDGDWPLKP